ncbi:MAG: GNAT family protein [Myxococcales bacterium]
MNTPVPPPSASPAPLEPVTLQGSHVRLEPLSLSHVPALVAVATGARGTYAFTQVPPDAPAMRRYVEIALAAQSQALALPFATVSLASGRVVGSTRFGNIESFVWPDGRPRRPPRCPDALEIGWTWLAQDVQRTAVNSEAKLLMLTHAFERLCVCRVNLRTDARNQRSRAAIERVGAKLDGILRAHTPAYDGAGIRDTASYSILAGEWPGVKAALQAKLARQPGASGA